jgi:hypothetical protein
MTLTLSGRLQTRLLLVLVVGVTWTALLTPLLPRPVEVTLPDTYRMTFTALGLMAIIGLVWELLYHALQQLRWDKDWPSLLALVTVVNEALAVWLVGHAVGLIRGPVGPSSPVLPLFATHFVTGYLLMWLFMQGPLRVLLVRWRFSGGSLIGEGSSARDGDLPPGSCRPALDGEGGRAPCAAEKDGTPDEGEPRGGSATSGSLVEGIMCRDQHFNHPRARFCAVCGHSLGGVGHGPARSRRPPLGVLITDEGRIYVVDHDVAVVLPPNSYRPRFERINRSRSASCRLEIRLREWQCVATCTDQGVPASLPDGRRLLLEPRSSLPLLPGTELVIGNSRILFQSQHQPTAPPADILPETGTAGTPEPGRTGVRETRRPAAVAAQAIRLAPHVAAYLATFAAIILSAHILLVVFRISPDTVVSTRVRDLATILSPGLEDLVTLADLRRRVLVGDGLAAALYLTLGHLIVRLHRNRGAGRTAAEDDAERR